MNSAVFQSTCKILVILPCVVYFVYSIFFRLSDIVAIPKNNCGYCEKKTEIPLDCQSLIFARFVASRYFFNFFVLVFNKTSNDQKIYWQSVWVDFMNRLSNSFLLSPWTTLVWSMAISDAIQNNLKYQNDVTLELYFMRV